MVDRIPQLRELPQAAIELFTGKTSVKTVGGIPELLVTPLVAVRSDGEPWVVLSWGRPDKPGLVCTGDIDQIKGDFRSVWQAMKVLELANPLDLDFPKAALTFVRGSYKPGSEPPGTGFHNYYENEEPSATVRLMLALGGPRQTEEIFLDVVRMKPSIDEILIANERLRSAELTFRVINFDLR